MAGVRRKDCEETDESTILSFLDSSQYGVLSFVRPDGRPGIVAVNFVRIGRSICFHSAPEGEKMGSLALNPRVAFLVASDLALAPSYFRASETACAATQYYRSVVVHGAARMVGGRGEKAEILQAFMEKYQPEGGHRPIAAEVRAYRRQLDATAVIAISMEEVTAKFKLGQNLPDRTRSRVARQLVARGAPGDLKTAELLLAAKAARK